MDYWVECYIYLVTWIENDQLTDYISKYRESEETIMSNNIIGTVSLVNADGSETRVGDVTGFNFTPLPKPHLVYYGINKTWWCGIKNSRSGFGLAETPSLAYQYWLIGYEKFTVALSET